MREIDGRCNDPLESIFASNASSSWWDTGSALFSVSTNK